MASAEITEVAQNFQQADKATRQLIKDHLKTVEWRRRQVFFLEWAGLVAGLLVVGSFLWASVHLITAGHSVSGTILGSVDMIGLVTVFVVRQPKPELSR